MAENIVDKAAGKAHRRVALNVPVKEMPAGNIGPAHPVEVTNHDVRNVIDLFYRGRNLEAKTREKLVETFDAGIVASAVVCEQKRWSNIVIEVPIENGLCRRTRVADNRSL